MILYIILGGIILVIFGFAYMICKNDKSYGGPGTGGNSYRRQHYYSDLVTVSITTEEEKEKEKEKEKENDEGYILDIHESNIKEIEEKLKKKNYTPTKCQTPNVI
ncbi:hypothetical protein MSI_15800 [Treponema sp. JC4]|uniref:hypothetical protein n=1 Tax=Treponema sp. JC4 TaxID=1124982 RepID=UPI00025B0C57|nr:hypothetical protein [Treponema sp. JC4]EID84884.1 hypothetical protein MSI_15800 [Treponema sp. JC4]